MTSQISRAPPSIAMEPGLAAGVLRLLDHVDDLPFGSTGFLDFGGAGVVLVQEKRVCWAATRAVRPRLTDILRHQHEPPISRESIEAVLRSCRSERLPIGEALVRSGLVSEAGLRTALLEQTREALMELSRINGSPRAFVPHAGTGYEPRFSFSSAELLAGIGAAFHPSRAAAAHAQIAAAVVPECNLAAFVRPPGHRGALLLAVDRGCALPAGGVIEACNWATGLLDVARTVDPTAWVARAVFCARTALLTWQGAETGYVGLCSSRAATARLMTWIESRAAPASATLAPARGAGS